MSWVTIIWAMIASACLTLALLHVLVWWRRREARANLLFALTAVATAVFAGFELWMMQAATPGAFGMAVGRPWLAWTVCAVRTLSLILNFVCTPNLNYREITALRHVSFLGETVVVAEGVPNPWMLIGQLSLLLLLIFVADAAITVWRRGDRRQALSVGGSIVFFVVAATGQAILTLWGIIHAPIIASLFFMAIVAAMSYELSQDLFRAAQLSDDLRDSEERMSLAAEAANLGMWVWDVVSDEVWMTNKVRALFGFAPDTRLDRAALIACVHPEDRAARAAAIRHALETKGEYSIEYRVLLPDGTLRWIGARGRTSSAPFSTKVGSTLPAAHWSRSLAMGGQRAFTVKTSTAVLKSMLTPLTPGNRSRWNTACDEATVNIAGFWILERRALPPMARSSGTSVLALTSLSASRRRNGSGSSWKLRPTASSWSMRRVTSYW